MRTAASNLHGVSFTIPIFGDGSLARNGQHDVQKCSSLNEGDFVRGSKYDFSVVKDKPAPKFDHKSPIDQPEKTNGIKRKTPRRPKVFKSTNWYERAASTVGINAKP